MIRVLADLILELFLNRTGHIENAEKLLEMVQFQQIQMYVTDQCLQKIRFYSTRE
jgi:hypothetical protein